MMEKKEYRTIVRVKCIRCGHISAFTVHDNFTWNTDCHKCGVPLLCPNNCSIIRVSERRIK